ncbi:hypothetical protein FPRO05_10719 [Fusarium proliferatum]|uniref:Uncharacterized protein n=1 Tax=Gibberella intermedia TaxID=948311 RepID=A0A365NC81_GIBIN|nr:hypothetical protein FPRO05_10719 [Fusarium proliferatum]
MPDQSDPISDVLADLFVNFHNRAKSARGQPTAQFGHIKIPSYRPETSISEQDDFDVLERLLEASQSQCRFTELDLAQCGEQDPTRNCTVTNTTDIDTQVPDILARVREEPETSRSRGQPAPRQGGVAVGATIDDIGPLIDGLEDAKTLLMLIPPDVAMSRHDNLNGIVSVNESAAKGMEETFSELARLLTRQG